MTVPAYGELACPNCLGELDELDDRRPIPSLDCPRCDRVYSAEAGFVDFIGHHDGEAQHGAHGLGPRLMHSRALAGIYERVWRPLFIAVASAGQADYARELEQVLAALAPARGGAVVDLSCGPGFTGRDFIRTGAFARVYGLDWSVAMLQRALAADDPEFPLLRADVARLPFARASLAGVHAGAALHMWPDPQSAIAEAARVLRPGGVLVATTFAHGRLRPLTAGFQAISSARVYEVDELAGMCRAHGLQEFTPELRGALILFSATRA